jgi:hypothetical protein
MEVIDKNLDDFIDWLQSNGAYIASEVKIKESSDKGKGLYISKSNNATDNERILVEVPANMLITADNLLNSKDALAEFLQQLLGNDMVINILFTLDSHEIRLANE